MYRPFLAIFSQHCSRTHSAVYPRVQEHARAYEDVQNRSMDRANVSSQVITARVTAYQTWGSSVLSSNRSSCPLCTRYRSRLWPSPGLTTTCWTSSHQKGCPAGAWTCRLWPTFSPTSTRYGTTVSEKVLQKICMI